MPRSPRGSQRPQSADLLLAYLTWPVLVGMFVVFPPQTAAADRLTAVAACLVAAYLGYLATSVLGGLLGRLWAVRIVVGLGRMRWYVPVGRRVLIVRRLPGPVRVGWAVPPGGAGTLRRLLPAALPVLASVVVFGWAAYAYGPSVVGGTAGPWQGALVRVSAASLFWLALVGRPLSRSTPVPCTRMMLHHPRLPWLPREFVPASLRASMARYTVATLRDDAVTARRESAALADQVPDDQRRDMEGCVLLLEGRIREAVALDSATLAAHGADVAEVASVALRFCGCVLELRLAGEPVDADTYAEARRWRSLLDGAVPVACNHLDDARACLVDGDVDGAVRHATRAARTATMVVLRGEAFLLLAMAAHMRGDAAEAASALRHGRRLAPRDSLLPIAQRRLASPDTTIVIEPA